MSDNGAELPVAQEGMVSGYDETARHKATINSDVQKSNSSGNKIMDRWLTDFYDGRRILLMQPRD